MRLLALPAELYPRIFCALFYLASAQDIYYQTDRDLSTRKLNFFTSFPPSRLAEKYGRDGSHQKQTGPQFGPNRAQKPPQHISAAAIHGLSNTFCGSCERPRTFYGA